MQARAKAAEATREKILTSGQAAFEELPVEEITLAWVAKRAGVSVQTVIRHFGTKEGVFMAVLQRAALEMGGDRYVEPGAGVKEIVDVLIDHYERFGDRILRMLSQEQRVTELALLAELGRTYHLEWCKQAFFPSLKGLRGARRERRLAQFVVLTDIYVWKILRRDRAFSVTQTKLTICEMLEPLTQRQR
jgi:AcrR family transcriptional regulator